MSILISTGNLGSGKTASIVYEFYRFNKHRKIYTNIKCVDLPNVVLITPEMFINKKHVRDIIKRDGSIEKIFEYSVNKDFWINRKKEAISIVIDEAHTIYSSRSSQSKVNKIFSEFLALARKVLSSDPNDEGGQLIFITQTPRKIDINARELALYRHHRCTFKKTCTKCNLSWLESSDFFEPTFMCPRCEHHILVKSDWTIEVWKFSSEDDFYKWKEANIKSYYDYYIIPPNEITKIFNKYNTLQFDDLFSSI